MLKNVQRSSRVLVKGAFEALAGAGGGAALWARQGTACAERGDLIGALQCFRRSVEIDFNCIPAWAGLSEAFDRLRDRRRADACLDVATRLRLRTAGEATA